MARKKIEINPLWAERVQQVMIEQGLKQWELAEKIHCAQQTISKIVTGVSGLTPDTAKQINEAFPVYSESWLLGLDESSRSMERKEATQIMGACMDGLYSLASSGGYKITPLPRFDGDVVPLENDGTADLSIYAERLCADVDTEGLCFLVEDAEGNQGVITWREYLAMLAEFRDCLNRRLRTIVFMKSGAEKSNSAMHYVYTWFTHKAAEDIWKDKEDGEHGKHD